eukprot:CAMPEP_0179188424 /NCGR_PEP_ID=MMETSP0796-20121207/93517_1 /TAXON_ID=73915 /ORGANISM="Pyrodinium bahamense, Strain pbaha01" /LENGTH=283 /DNA_ID=CAMNT_0020892523 /DNA_START=65 /DNA_END=916 /DNA_ORIENTATION=+
MAAAAPASNSKVVSDLASGAFPTATFPCDHLSTVGVAAKTGAAPRPRRPSFPNDHIQGPVSAAAPEGSPKAVEAASWAPPETRATAQSLRQAVNETDWRLGCFCHMLNAQRVLEIGAFCGAASMSMAEVLPSGGEVVSLDIDPFPFQEVGREFKAASPHFSKVRFIAGPASQSLESLVAERRASPGRPFDLVVIDADKAGLRGYFDMVSTTPGMLSGQASICVDVTPFKGTPPERYVKYGQADRWIENSGQEEIDAFRSYVQASPEFVTFELAGMLVVRRVLA